MGPTSPDGRRSRWLVAWVLFWALAGGCLAAAIAHGPLSGIAHVQDEVVYTWQAKRLTEGRLWVPEPSPRAAWFYHFFVDRDGRRYGVFPNGWPFVLALGVALGVPAYVNALLHALTILFGGLLGRRAGGTAGGFLAAPLLALSPQALLQGASRMSHVLVALLTLVAAVVVLDKRPLSPGRGVVLGGAIGWIVLTRPLDAAVVAVVLLPMAFSRRESRRGVVACLVVLVGAVGLTGVENRALTGDAFRFPQSEYFNEMPAPNPGPFFSYHPGCNRLGFGPDRGCFVTFGSHGYTPTKAVLGARQNLRLCWRLWMGGVLGLLLLPLGLALPVARRITGVAIALWAGFVVAYGFYWYYGSCLGARFYHPALPLVVIACAVAAGALTRRLRISAAWGLLLLLPMATRISTLLPELHGYWGVDDRFYELERHWSRGEALVLVGYRDDLVMLRAQQTAGFAVGALPDMWRGSWFLASGPLHFAEYQPALVDAVRRRFPGLPTYLYIMSAAPGKDQMRPLIPADRAVIQRPDLSLPPPLPLFATSQTKSDRERLIREALKGR